MSEHHTFFEEVYYVFRDHVAVCAGYSDLILFVSLFDNLCELFPIAFSLLLRLSLLDWAKQRNFMTLTIRFHLVFKPLRWICEMSHNCEIFIIAMQFLEHGVADRIRSK